METERFADIVSELSTLKEHFYLLTAAQSNTHRFSNMLDTVNIPEETVRNHRVMNIISRNLGMFMDRVHFLTTGSALFVRADLADRDIIFELRDLDRMLVYQIEEIVDRIIDNCYQSDKTFYQLCGYGSEWDQVVMPEPVLELFNIIVDTIAQSEPGMMIHDGRVDYGQFGIEIYDLSNLRIAFERKQDLDRFLKKGHNKPPHFYLCATRRVQEMGYVWERTD
jgi:hypothetical protein